MEAKLPISSPLLPVPEMFDSRLSSSSAAASTAPSQDSSRHNSSDLESTPVPCPESSTIAETLKGLKMSENGPKQIFSSLGAIFRRAEKENDVVLVDEFRTVFEEADDDSRVGNRDVEALKFTKGLLDQLWESRSRYIASVAEVLADASRDRTLRQLL